VQALSPGTLASDHVSPTVRYLMSPQDLIAAQLFQLIASARVVVGEAGADMPRDGRGGAGLGFAKNGAGGSVSDLQVF
jgi:hypothetical protein